MNNEQEIKEVTISGTLKRWVVETLEKDLTIKKSDVVKYLKEELEADDEDLKHWDSDGNLLGFIESSYFLENIMPNICTLEEWQREVEDHRFNSNEGNHPYIKVINRKFESDDCKTN